MSTELHQYLSTDTALSLIRDFAKDAKSIPARHYIRTASTASGQVSPPVVGLEVSVRPEQWEALIAYADKIVFWHYAFDPKCGREVSIHVGHATYVIPVA
jgi:hypothetical protein